jgi:hypothetical protein
MDENSSGSHPVVVLPVSEVLNLRICYHGVGQLGLVAEKAM